MNEKLNNILNLVEEYISEKQEKESWSAGEDWVSYSGPIFDTNEYTAAIKQLLSGWLIFGRQGRDFELEFPKHLGKNHGILTNSGSSANLLMIAAAKSRRFPKQLKDGDKIIHESITEG